ncbi:MAG: amylo-alpha-1,6-glucosidase [Nitrospirae bacterium]|nr:MAG: amylo-alpha-1,6-glucosidase [Nitrospirota bacterium]
MAGHVIQIGSAHYILATSALADDRTRVLKHGDSFGLFNRYGDIQPVGLGEQGLYHEGTRFLSRFELFLGTAHPFLLSSTVRQDNTLLAVDLTNPDIYLDELTLIPRGSLHLSRAKVLWNGCCYERIRLTNYTRDPLALALSIQFEADFRDIFEVRGEKRSQRGKQSARVVNQDTVIIEYLGLDGIVRTTHISSSSHPSALTDSSLTFETVLAPREETVYELLVACKIGETPLPITTFSTAQASASRTMESRKAQFCSIYTGNEQFNDWVNRSLEDLSMMITDFPQGPVPYAGVPWYSTVFGRDSIITALQCLWANPSIARGVLAYLAANQAQETNPEQDAEPGKILHETRRGEMAALHEIPFARYYGSIDSTPLFIMLASAYYERTGDKAFIASLWPHIELALTWINQYGDQDRDGFVEYLRHSSHGLVQQGWKDSFDSVFHADGTLAQGPIALCEVQGYVFAAKMAASNLATILGYSEKAGDLFQQAQQLREQFHQRFWSDKLGMFVLALDGDKRPCRVRSSNAGHCLFTEITTAEYAASVAEHLLSDDFFSGWGIRTIPRSEVRYNPMSYHNGSVWPHDNALIAYGFSRYGFAARTHQILAGLFDMSIHVDLHRIPELVCGFNRRPGEGPILYPVACAPQTWAAGAVFLLLQACLGLSIQGADNEIRFTNPYLPEFLPFVQIKNLAIGKASADLMMVRTAEEDVSINVTRKDDPLNVVIVK